MGQGFGVSEIAKCLGRSRSTIYRELKRNSSRKTGYIPINAQKRYEKRRKQSKKHKRLEDKGLYELVKDRFLKHHRSPEQIALKKKVLRTISAAQRFTGLSMPECLIRRSSVGLRVTVE